MGFLRRILKQILAASKQWHFIYNNTTYTKLSNHINTKNKPADSLPWSSHQKSANNLWNWQAMLQVPEGGFGLPARRENLATLRVSANPCAPERPISLVKRPLIMKSTIFPSCWHTLSHLNLSHMDFLDGPAAIHWSRLIIYCTTQDASPNELTDPEIFKKNHHKYIHSFAGSWPAIFPGCVISSCACIVLLSEASSSSHVILPHCASARTPVLRSVKFPLSNVLWSWKL